MDVRAERLEGAPDRARGVLAKEVDIEETVIRVFVDSCIVTLSLCWPFHHTLVLSLIRGMAGHVAIRYPSIGLTKLRTVFLLWAHVSIQGSRPEIAASAYMPDTGDIEHDDCPLFETTKYPLLAVLRGQ